MSLRAERASCRAKRGKTMIDLKAARSAEAKSRNVVEPATMAKRS